MIIAFHYTVYFTMVSAGTARKANCYKVAIVLSLRKFLFHERTLYSCVYKALYFSSFKTLSPFSAGIELGAMHFV